VLWLCQRTVSVRSPHSGYTQPAWAAKGLDRGPAEQLFKVYLIEIQINSNLFQIQLKLVQTWKLDQITSTL
jgi:hypothetical protein